MKRKVSIMILSLVLVGVSILPTAAVSAADIKENLVDAEGYVYGSVYATPVHEHKTLSSIVPFSADHSCPNYARSKETLQLHYSGEIAFKANHKTNSTCGSGLQSGKNVKQGGIDYKRDNKSVIGGVKYTTVAPNTSDSTVRSATASCWDDLFDWGESGRTYFYRYWFYF